MELNFFRTVCATFLSMIFIVSAYTERPSLKLEETKHKYPYDEVLGLSLWYLEAQRSGILPKNKRVSWRGDSAILDRGDDSKDLTGGYYDGSDFVKFGYTMAFTTTVLAWGVISWPDAYESAGKLNEVREAIKWATDYFIKCHVSKYVLYGQVGDFDYDQQFWIRPEDMDMDNRPAFKIDQEHPGSDLAGETAAALAATSIVFKYIDQEYSVKCLQHALELFEFANDYRGSYTNSIPKSADYYKSTNYSDELAWAAIWIYKANLDIAYLQKATYFYQNLNLNYVPTAFTYDQKLPGVQVLLGQITGRDEFQNMAHYFCDYNIWHQKRTPKGLVYINKDGTLGLAANVAFICLQATDFSFFNQAERYYNFSKGQIDYMLGDSGRSYVVGFGENPPVQIYNPAASCPLAPTPCGWEDALRNASNPKILYGALVSGPDEKDEFIDIRMRVLYTETAIYYNAGFTGVLAGLIQLRGKVDSEDNRKKIILV